MEFCGRNITHKFKDVRGAVAYALSVRRGPQHRRPSWGEPRARGDRDAGHAVIAAVRGDLGIEPDSPEWIAMEKWALESAPTPTWIRKLRAILGQCGLLDDQPAEEVMELELEDCVFCDAVTGDEIHTVREVRED